ncbi:hypothetical protein M9408_02015 [Candidatus Blochmannia vicinus]|uniref:Uncharacterized protein n=1 Tax=Candidatus Blochmannia vicinus (nom. nud.) TaxID=251540 RepID=A0A9Q8X147_9ENTR|nr:hypothetical protein [Candidatus Blochmannia vicinus]URJ28085.1 hypothetical protein M9393_02810 [Candidatus Blochmannia vicinus]URJ30641.1 hypothetical protein M9402_00485 [Candidatus Blochmannia vicinus]URJ32786.1 hypothetical protein M9408_02015 [Candidatus Blochmannia vicinus]
MFKELKKYIAIRSYLIVYFFMPLICNSNINIVIEGLDGELNYNVREKLSDINTDYKYVDIDLKKK